MLPEAIAAEEVLWWWRWRQGRALVKQHKGLRESALGCSLLGTDPFTGLSSLGKPIL